MSIHYSLLQLKVSSDCQIFNRQVTYVYSGAQEKLSLFSYKQMPGQEEVIEMDIWKNPFPAPRFSVPETWSAMFSLEKLLETQAPVSLQYARGEINTQ